MSTVSASSAPRPGRPGPGTRDGGDEQPGAGDPGGGADQPPQKARGVTSLPAGLVKLARPKQWAKNVLVFAAPAAAGVLDNRQYAIDAAVAFVCFCLAASGTYYINDARDVEADRLHPRKRRRPVASGVVPVPVAYLGGIGLVAAGVALGFTINGALAATVGGYVALTTAYSSVLKHVAVVDLVAVAAGFVLRAVAGAAATNQHISNWFFIVTSFGALFMISGKRAAEAKEMGDGASDFRSVLAAYTTSYTAYLRSVSSGAVLVAYCLWAFEKAETVAATTVPWYQLSILPFVMAVLRYALVLDQGRGSAPEEIVLGDRPLQLIGIAWAVVFAIGVYTA
ncbi:MAG TPA: decaprenyl-phosphate phosphoribosyltransferase [Acidimicrobiales bacterium]|jgi:decaprenyl-phosphate phosphoribosyltransferase|nr:decaprenyl-phosphate phosphoribosyltransferase [Acidimicrobiales bacterium]